MAGGGLPRGSAAEAGLRGGVHDVRTVQRWRAGNGLKRGDGRPHALRPTLAHALSAQERRRMIEVANEPRFAELPPARIVPLGASLGDVWLDRESLPVQASGFFSIAS